MSGVFSKLKGAASGSLGSTNSNSCLKRKNTEPEAEASHLVKMLQYAGPDISKDGSDKFFGMENFGNTCYCNSIVQILYHSVPFRERILSYPPQDDSSNPIEIIKSVPSIRAPVQDGSATTTTNPKQQNLFNSDLTKKKVVLNASQTTPIIIGNRLEDKPDSPEYKKKQALTFGPVLELNFDNSRLYGMKESTYTTLKDIFTALVESKSRTGVISPQRFLEVFRRENEMFRTSMHQDAHEFYGLVLNSVISNVDARAQQLKMIAPVVDNTQDQAVGNFSSGAKTIYPSDKTRTSGTRWVHEIFEGVLTSETKCLTCETTSQRDETFLDLSIDLDKHTSVTSCLRKFSAEEMLCEKNKFYCDTCGGLQEAERRMKIKRLPKILALHLKRFKYMEDMTRLQKLFHRVVYPYQLKMFNTADDAEDPDRLYELYAVVVHIGSNAYHGHYVSVIKTQDRGWLLFDDEMVEPVDEHFAQNFFGDKPGMACAYVLFYQDTCKEADESLELEKSIGTELVENITEKSSVDYDSYVSSASEPLNSKLQHQENKVIFPIDSIPSASLPDSASLHDAAPLPYSSLTSASPFGNPFVKDVNIIKNETKESQKFQRHIDKMQTKEQNFSAKDGRESKTSCRYYDKVEEIQFEQKADSPSLLTTEDLAIQRDKGSFIRGKYGALSIGRKGLAILNGVRNYDNRKSLAISSKGAGNHDFVEANKEHRTLENSLKHPKDKFSFITLRRKKSGLLPT